MQIMWQWISSSVMTACGMQWEVHLEKNSRNSFVKFLYDDTGPPSTHGHATRSVHTTLTPILSSCVVLSATLLFNCDTGELQSAPPYSVKQLYILWWCMVDVQLGIIVMTVEVVTASRFK